MHELALAACAGAGATDLALSSLAALEDMPSPLPATKPWPPMRAYITALTACARAGAPAQLLETAMHMRHLGLDPGNGAFSLALEAHARAGDAPEALRWLKAMPEQLPVALGLRQQEHQQLAHFNWVLRAWAAARRPPALRRWPGDEAT